LFLFFFVFFVFFLFFIFLVFLFLFLFHFFFHFFIFLNFFWFQIYWDQERTKPAQTKKIKLEGTQDLQNQLYAALKPFLPSSADIADGLGI